MTTGMKFILLAAQVLTVSSAVIVALHPNILYASIALLFSFLGVAFMFVFAGADFLAGAQVVVYVGGVTILILFAIMLTQGLYQVKLRDIRSRLWFPVIVLVPAMGWILHHALKQVADITLRAPPEKMDAFAALPKTAEIGTALLGNHILAFEAVTILLLGALVGGVWLARPK
jgi:NADH-quinone oxidoreductase subunit J